MANFKELSTYKNKIILRLIESQDICKALYYNLEDFLSQPDIEDTTSLIYKNILPHYFVPLSEELAMNTYLSIHYKKFRLIGNSFVGGLLYLSVYTNKNLFKTAYGQTRIDFLLNKVDEIMGNKHGIGVGRLELYEMDEMFINNNYTGAYLAYRPVDFR